MIQKAEKAIPEFYKKYKTGYREVIFDHLELGYCLRQTEDQDTYCLCLHGYSAGMRKQIMIMMIHIRHSW